MTPPSHSRQHSASAVGSLAAHAQQQGAAAAAPSPSVASPKAQDCPKANVARHDHAAESGSGSMAAKPWVSA